MMNNKHENYNEICAEPNIGDEEMKSEMESEVSIGWRNLRFETKGWFGNGNKVILNRLNGCFEYHTLNGIMGPSGAGKTTLLNCLCGNRVQGLTEDSEIFLNKDMQDGKVVSYFIEQHVQNTIMGKMRVGQILRYAYRFKNGGEGDMERHIRTTIKELLLDEKVLDRKFEQCSGGEQKRIAIAQELMSLRKPTLLFVDEPTTGLDSNAAHLLMQCLKQLATNHRMTVVTSIHVPSDDILNLFDKLYVLAKGGVCIYSGRPEKLRSHLETKIEDLVIQDEQPPIEVLTKIACSGISDQRVVILSNQTLFAEYQIVGQHLSNLVSHPTGVPNHRKPFSVRDFFLQLGRMSHTALIIDFRNILLQMIAGLLFFIIMLTLLDSDIAKPSGCNPLSFPAIDDNDNNDTTSVICTNHFVENNLIRKNVVFIGTVAFFELLVVICIGAVFSAPFIRMFRNEYRNHWYSLGTFFWSATIVGLLQALLYAIVYSISGYLLAGEHYVDDYLVNWQRLGHFLFYFIILAVYMFSIGQLTGIVVAKNLELALIFGSFFCLTFVIYSGYVIDLQSSNNILFKLIVKTFQYDSIIKGLIYSIYGLDRCDLEREYSLTLANFHVERSDYLGSIFFPVQEVLIKTGLIQLSTLAYLHWKFNIAGKHSRMKQNLDDRMMTIDYETQEINSIKNDQNNNKILITKRDKSTEEMKFEKFSRGKIIVAWKDLSLFGTSFMFERTGQASDSGRPVEKAILKNLNGEFRFGTLNALMGTSGAGKTSLLKVLNGRDKKRLSGSSQFYLSKFTRIQTCFITQDVSGHLLPGLTAKQTLIYASRLKNAQLCEFGVDTSQIDHQQIALNLLDELELSDTVNTLVEKCSGGERKRLALALELTALQMPNLICIDEPTSGLDSNSAEVVVACLRKLTQTHSITIVTSIHQPNSELLRMFDQIYVLARGGVCIYSGTSTAILSHLETVTGLSSFDTNFPIEALIKFSCLPFPDPTVRHLMSINDLHFSQTIVDSGLLYQESMQVLDGIQQNRRRFSLEDTCILCDRYLAYIRGYLWREWLIFLIVFSLFAIFAVNLFDPSIGTVSGCLNLEDDFNNSCTKTEKSIEDENVLSYNVQYTMVAFYFCFVLILIQAALSFLRESVFFFNEHRNGWYSSGSFYLSRSLFETVPILLLMPVYVYFCNIYEQSTPGIYYSLVLVMCLGAFAFQGFTHICCLLTGGRLLPTSLAIMSTFMLGVIFTNFIVTYARLHYIYRLLINCNITSHMFNAVMLLEFGFGRCLPKQIQPLLYLYGLDDADYYRAVFAIVFITILYHSVALAMLIRYANPIIHERRNQIERQVRDQTDRLCQSTNTIIAPGIGSYHEFRIKQIRF